MVYVTWIEDVPDQLRDRPAQWRAHLDKIMEPKLTDEEQAAQEVEDARVEQERRERLAETWGVTPEHLASQQAMLAMMGGEG